MFAVLDQRFCRDVCSEAIAQKQLAQGLLRRSNLLRGNHERQFQARNTWISWIRTPASESLESSLNQSRVESEFRIAAFESQLGQKCSQPESRSSTAARR